MAKFTIWGRVRKNASGEFVATAGAIGLRSEDQERTQIATETCASQSAAEAARDRLVTTLREALLQQGHEIIDIDVR